jgi:DNA-binding HxlR family transcriptional regulator
MMRAIAERMAGRGFTLPELAIELDVEQDALLERLFMMERLGFIVRSGGCNGSSHAEDAPCRCPGCSGCREPRGREVVGYTLTEKGKRLAGIKGLKGEVV